MDEPRDPIIEGAFQALERTFQAPSNFYQLVSARLRPPQTRRQLRFGRAPLFSGAWGLALATCLLVSLGFNVLWGSGVIGTRTTAPVPSFEPIRAARLQRQILNNSILTALGEGLGMAGLPSPVLFFRIGTGYIESLALLQDNQPEHALQRLHGMIDALETVSAPAELITYLQDIQVLIRHQVHANPRLARFLAHFEVLYQEAYHAPSERQGAGAAALTLFRTGAWLENMDLAAQVGDRAALQQGPASTYFRGALQSLGVQPALLNALAQIEHLITQPELSDRQVETVHELVQNLQHQLST